MKKLVIAVSALSCALAAVAADAKDPKKDPRRNYSSDGWKLAWSDEFDGKGTAPNSANWKPEVGFLRNQEPQYYTSNRVENCCVKDGVLTITARKEQWPNPLYKDRHLGGWYRQREFAKYTSADLQSVRTFHYGRVEFRAQMPGGWGAWPALWFLGGNLSSSTGPRAARSTSWRYGATTRRASPRACTPPTAVRTPARRTTSPTSTTR